MSRVIDALIAYRVVKLLVTPFNKTEAFKLGIIDEKGKRSKLPGTNKSTPLNTIAERNAYTVLHKLVFNIKKIFEKVPGLRTKLGTYAAALFLLKDTFRESVDPKMFEREFLNYIKENNIEIDDTISEEVDLEGELLPKGEYELVNDIVFDEEDENALPAIAGDKLETFEDTAPIDTVLGVPVFPIIHIETRQKIFVSLDDIKKVSLEDALGEL